MGRRDRASDLPTGRAGAEPRGRSTEAGQSRAPRLVTIPFSHYCEKARWALDRASIAYVEDSHLPLFAWAAALRAGRHRTVPSLVTGERTVTDSTDILRWVDAHALFPPGDAGAEVAELEDRFDRSLGPHTRRIAYGFVLPHLRELAGDARGVPRYQIQTAQLLAPIMGGLMRRLLRIDDAGVARSQERVDEIFEEVGRRLGDGRRYLTGDRFTAADLTFAALATPVVAPPELGELLPLDRVDDMAAELARYRGTPAGAFALRLYAEDRGRPGAAAQPRAA
jgi:glutathione S-transferase